MLLTEHSAYCNCLNLAVFADSYSLVYMKKKCDVSVWVEFYCNIFMVSVYLSYLIFKNLISYMMVSIKVYLLLVFWNIKTTLAKIVLIETKIQKRCGQLYFL